MKLSYIFPGQGSQSVGMGRDFYENSAVAKQMFQEASDALKFDFKELLFTQNERLEKTEFTQPAIFLVSAIAHKLFTDEYKATSTCALGHSLGEFVALYASGALSLENGVKLVHERGKLMSEACSKFEGGMMVLLGLSDDKVEELCKSERDGGKKVWAANYNSDGQIVVAGIKSDLASLESVFKDAGAKRAMLLNMSVASHCPLLSEVGEPLGAFMDEYIKDSFNTPVISNVTAKPYDTKSEALKLLKEQLVAPVLYKQSIKAVDNEVDIFVEFGGKVLQGLNKKITQKSTCSIVDLASLKVSLEEVSR